MFNPEVFAANLLYWRK